MEAYKRDLCQTYFECDSEPEILGFARANRYMYNLNANGRLHSNYMEGYYEPAIINRVGTYMHLYYLFDGEIVDCAHPFYVVVNLGVVHMVEYFSSNRIQNNEAICIYIDNGRYIGRYNSTIEGVILDGYEDDIRLSNLDIEVDGYHIICNNMMLVDNFMMF